ncbi:MAG: hypothetical protein DMG97_10795 [Acidobacteria bacterium]|nr:MAG: hypothetical protein DMG97_10795 [Acidobacteriota bacterium]
MKKPELRVTKFVGGKTVQGTCSACPTVIFDTGSLLRDNEDHQRELERLFAEHFRQVHLREDASQSAARIVREATENH